MEHIFNYEKGRITVSGVVSLDEFEEKEVKIRLENNSLTVRGSGFALQEMAKSSGRVAFIGKVSSVEYAVKGEKIPFWKRLLK